MAQNETRRLSPRTLKQDKDCFVSIKGITGYKPSKDDYKVSNLEAADQAVTDDQEKEQQAAVNATTAHDRAVASEWAFHNLILGAKKQIIAQFGDNSDEVKCVGLKKKIEYKRGAGRKAKSKAA